jgi:hypothetical protein
LDSFIARQPIFDDHQKVYGYELLFRSSLDNVFRSSDPDQATSKVLTDSFSLYHVYRRAEEGASTSPATFSQGLRLLIPEDQIVVVLETIRPDAEVIEACCRRKPGTFWRWMTCYSEAIGRCDLADFIKVTSCKPRMRSGKGLEMLAKSAWPKRWKTQDV